MRQAALPAVDDEDEEDLPRRKKNQTATPIRIITTITMIMIVIISPVRRLGGDGGVGVVDNGFVRARCVTMSERNLGGSDILPMFTRSNIS